MARGRKGTTRDPLLKSAEMLGWALGGLEREITQTRQRLAELTAQAAQLRARLGTSKVGTRAAATVEAAHGAVKTAGRKRRTMSDEARKRISEMMKKRWAERKKA